MFWGAVSPYGPVALVRLRGCQSLETYDKTVRQTLPEFREKFGKDHGRDIIFQQDNASCHVLKKTLEYFEKDGISLHVHPAKFPDLNPIEHMWRLMKGDV